jgi:predicted Zn finger-like uncharacterized protein
MRIKCPKCLATYDVPDRALPKEKSGDKPQKMRCFRCKTIFSVMLRPETRAEHPVQIVKNDPISKPANIVSETSAWTGKTTLDLGGFEAKGQMPIRRFFFLCLVTGFAIVVLFFLFVAGRNDWVLSFPNLSDQIVVAFWGEAAKPPPEAAVKLEVKVEEGHRVILQDDDSVLVVTGEIVNPSEEIRSNVVLNGRIVGSDGKARYETSAPCGKVFKNAKIKKTKRGEFDKLYSRKGKVYDCRVKSKSKRKYMLIFDNIPPDYSEKYKVEVRVVQARTSEPEEKSR